MPAPFRAAPSPRRHAPLVTAAIAACALVAGAGAAQAGWPGLATTPSPRLVAPVAFFGFGGPTGPEVVEMLYRRYGAARVLYVRPMGDIYEAELVDRSGFRMHYTIDSYDGRVLERFIVGRVAPERPVPIPPGTIPGGRLMPDRAPPPPIEAYRDPYGPRAGYPREAGLPPAGPAPGLEAPRTVAPAGPAPRPGAVETQPLPQVQPLPQMQPAPQAVTPGRAPAVAARPAPTDIAPAPRNDPATAPEAVAPPSAPSVATPSDGRPAATRPERKPATARVEPAVPKADLPKPDAIRPETVRPAVPPVAPSPAPQVTTTPAPSQPRAEVKAVVPAVKGRIPEPLIDPKTGRPSVSVPVAPLDDTPSKPAAPAAPMVPPATLD